MKILGLQFGKNPTPATIAAVDTPNMKTLAPGREDVGRIEPVMRSVPRRRQYSAAKTDNLLSSWTTQSRSIDADLRAALPILIARSRELDQNNDYAAQFFNMLSTNVIGPNGMKFSSQAVEYDGSDNPNDRKLINEAFADWSHKENCTVEGRNNLTETAKMFIETTARDGAILIRFIRGAAAGNKYGFAIELMECDALDVGYNLELKNGNIIKMGVETNKFGRPIAYHVCKYNPLTNDFERVSRNYERISARDMLHPFVTRRPKQTRGVPWMSPAMWRLNMLGGYEEAELVASRAGAAKMGFYENETGKADEIGDDIDSDGEYLQDMEAGTFSVLPAGTKFTSFDPQHPTSQFEAFTKLILRGISSGLGVSYNTLANDLQGVNYSSLRQGAINERDVWKKLQAWTISNFYKVIAQEFIKSAITTGALPLPPRKLDQFLHVKFQARGWQWVDPQKEAKANIDLIAAGLKSHSQVLAENGNDYETVLKELTEEKELAKKYGFTPIYGNNSNPGKEDQDDEKTKPQDDD